MAKRYKSMGRLVAMTAAVVAGAGPVWGTVYYVSPTGSDADSGTSASDPWQSVAKVDATAFQPGDQILFQYGGQWGASLAATSSGTAAAPIVYGAYGNAALGKPLFSGSDPIAASAFTPVTGTTYQASAATPVNWFYDNHQFTHESQDVLAQAGAANPNDAAANLSYVEANPDSFYYNPATAALYVNLGGSLAGHTLTVGTRQDAVLAYQLNNLVFSNLATTETAADQGGYGFRLQNTANVTVTGCVATQAGKHNFGAISSTGFVGQNLFASGSAPDQGLGGASAFVSYSDANPARPNPQNNTYAWSNLTYTHANGIYPAFITHGDTGAVASVSVTNLTANDYGAGVAAYSTGPTERITLANIHLGDAAVEVDTDNSTVSGLTLNGPDATVALGGAHDVLQSSLIVGTAPNPNAGHNGAVLVNGTDDTVRFNTFSTTAGGGPVVALSNTSSGSHLYGNVFDAPQPIRVYDDNGLGQFDADENLYTAANPVFATGDVYHPGTLTLAQWQADGYDLDSAVGPADFADAADGDYSLLPGSAGQGLVAALPDGQSPPVADLDGNLYPATGPYAAGAIVPEPTTVGIVAATAVLASRRRWRR